MKRLGRGLADIIEIPQQQQPTTSPVAGFVMLRSDQIRPGKFQPRTTIKDTGLEELKASIKQSGIIEPVVVRPSGHDAYELIAGERRFRAAKALGINTIPAIVKSLSDQQALELSLIENIQREDLNPLEEARGYARLIEEFGYTQETVADAVGKERATVANIVRILRLPDEVRQGLLEEKISLGHAKLLVSIEDRARLVSLYQETATKNLSVRQLELLVASWTPVRRRRARRADPEIAALENELRQLLGTKVSVRARAKKGGRIVIEYFSSEDLARILQALKAVG